MKISLAVLFTLLTFQMSFGQNTQLMKEVLSPYEFSSESIALEDGEISYYKAGKGEKVLLFIHGLSSNADAWQRNIQELQKEYTCIALDLPGHGKSFLQGGQQTPSYFAKIILELMEKLGHKKFTLVGHSMGGQAALKFALLYPEKLEQLVLVAPAGIEEFTFTEAQMMLAFTTPKALESTSDEQIEKNYHLNFYQFPKEAEKMVEDRKKIRQASDFSQHMQAVVQSVKGMLIDPVHEQLAEVKVPTLIVFGQNDALIPNRFLHPQLTLEDLAEKARTEIPTSKVVVLPESGHFLMFERPREFNEVLRGFIN